MPSKYRWREMERENARRVNPPQQLAGYEASRAPDEPYDEEYELSDEVFFPRIIADMRAADFYMCDNWQGTDHWPESSRTNEDDHADASQFTDAELIELWKTDETGCLLHIDTIYPAVPSCVWNRQVWEAYNRLDALDRDPDDAAYHVTHDELREMLDDLPHARFYIERQHDVGRLKLKVID